MTVIQYPAPNDPNEKRKQCVGIWLRLLAETKIRRAGDELTQEKCEAYDFELRDIPIERLERAFRRASRECRFFPAAVEIRDLCADPDANASAYRRLCERYEEAYADGRLPKSLPSVLDHAPPGLAPVGRTQTDLNSVLTRGQKITLRIEDPAPIDVPSRLAELRRQAEIIRNGSRKEE